MYKVKQTSVVSPKGDLYTFKIMRDVEWQDYILKVTVNNTPREGWTYYSDSKADIIDTMEFELSRAEGGYYDY